MRAMRWKRLVCALLVLCYLYTITTNLFSRAAAGGQFPRRELPEPPCCRECGVPPVAVAQGVRRLLMAPPCTPEGGPRNCTSSCPTTTATADTIGRCDARAQPDPFWPKEDAQWEKPMEKGAQVISEFSGGGDVIYLVKFNDPTIKVPVLLDATFVERKLSKALRVYRAADALRRAGGEHPEMRVRQFGGGTGIRPDTGGEEKFHPNSKTWIQRSVPWYVASVSSTTRATAARRTATLSLLPCRTLPTPLLLLPRRMPLLHWTLPLLCRTLPPTRRVLWLGCGTASSCAATSHRAEEGRRSGWWTLLTTTGQCLARPRSGC